MDIYIYALVVKETGLPFYVGQSSRPKMRLSEHKSKARFWAKKKVSNPQLYAQNCRRRVTREIINIWDKGNSIGVAILETVEDKASVDREGIWIQMLRDQGYGIVNQVPPVYPVMRHKKVFIKDGKRYTV